MLGRFKIISPRRADQRSDLILKMMVWPGSRIENNSRLTCQLDL